jgi:hypothetical protein
MPVEPRRSYFRLTVFVRAGGGVPVGFIEDDDFVSSGGESDFLLCESLDSVSDDVEASTV